MLTDVEVGEWIGLVSVALAIVTTLGALVMNGFSNVNRRIDDTNKRIESFQANTDRRFEMIQANMDRRFEMLQANMDRRFEMFQATPTGASMPSKRTPTDASQASAQI